MTSRVLPGAGIRGGYAPGDDGWGDEMVVNLLTMSAIMQLGVISRVTALPGSPADGNIYIVPSGAGSNPNKVAVRDNGAWTYLTPVTGWRAFVVDEGVTYLWNGTAWVTNPIPVEVNGFTAGVLTSNQKILRRVFTRSTVFKDDFVGARANAGTTATASTVITLQRNGSSIGTLTFGAGSGTGTFATTGSGVEAFAAGDVLSLVAPSSADATLADVSISIPGIG